MSNNKIEKLLAEMRLETNLERRKQLKAEIQKHIMGISQKQSSDLSHLKPPRSLEEIKAESKAIAAECRKMLREMINICHHHLAKDVKF